MNDNFKAEDGLGCSRCQYMKTYVSEEPCASCYIATNNPEDAIRFVDSKLTADQSKEQAKLPRIICISGKAQHGKDTVAANINELLRGMGIASIVIHYGDLLKFICKTFFGWNGQKGTEGRELLQQVGTNIIREQKPDYWVDFVINALRLFRGQWEVVIIADCRFPNEVDKIKSCGFDVTHLRIVRPSFDNGLTEEQKAHPSETALDGHEYDELILNRGTLFDLKYDSMKFAAAFYRGGAEHGQKS